MHRLCLSVFCRWMRTYFVKSEVGCGNSRLSSTWFDSWAKPRAWRRTDSRSTSKLPAARPSCTTWQTMSTINFFNDDDQVIEFLKLLIHVDAFTMANENAKLTKLLKEIEITALRYVTKTRKSVVLVIDNADCLLKKMPEALEQLQTKAKLWADWSAVKVVFIIHDDETETLLRQD